MSTKTAEERAAGRFPDESNSLSEDRKELYDLEQHPEDYWTDGQKARHTELKIRTSIQASRSSDNYVARKVWANCIREEVEPLEAKNASLTEENAKLRSLVQELVNDMRRLRIEFGNRTGTTTQIGIASLTTAEEQGFVPANTEDNG